MRRIIPLIICACWIASFSGSAFAQILPDCDRATAEKVTYAGGVPTLTGCSAVDVEYLFDRLRQRYRVFVNPDPSATGFPPRIITRQEQEKLNLTFYFSTGAGYPPHHPTYSIRAPAQVQEGVPLTVTVHQDDSDHQPHNLSLKFDPPDLMAGEAPSFTFPPDTSDKILAIDTAKGTPGDGDKTLTVGLLSADEGTAVGDPGSVKVKILDTPPTVYTIVASERIVRGDPIEFRIDRSGPLIAAQLDFDVQQGKDRISPDGMPHPLVFRAGEASRTLTLRPDFYDKCGPPPTLDLNDGSGHPNSASAAFDGICPTGWLEWLEKNVPYWPWPAIPAGILLGFGLWRLARRIFNGRSEEPVPAPPPLLYPTWQFEEGIMPPPLDPPQIPDWPKFRGEVEIDWGGADVPDPLPLAETTDG